MSEPSNITEQLIALLKSRDAFGQAKYGTSLDREDLAAEQWLQHQTEEMLDAAGYAQATIRQIAILRAEVAALQCTISEIQSVASSARSKHSVRGHQCELRDAINSICDRAAIDAAKEAKEAK